MSGVSEHRAGVSDRAMTTATGRHPEEWFALLDQHHASTWDHSTIARWLMSEHGVDGWWAQSITVRYEQSRGMRLPGQQPDGTFAVSASRRYPIEQDALLERVVERLSERVGHPPATVRRDAKYKTARWRVGEETLLATVNPTSQGRTQVSLTRSKIPDPERSALQKERLGALLDDLAAALR